MGHETAGERYRTVYPIRIPHDILLPMKILHFEKNFHYTDREFLTVARKVGKLATYCKRIKDESSSIRIEAERRRTRKEQDRIKMTVTVDLPGKQLRAETRKYDIVEAIDRCVEKLEPQVKRYKERIQEKRRCN